MLVESWKEWEESVGSEEHITEVMKKVPKRIIKKRQIITEDGRDAGFEEYYDYIFPGEQTAVASNLKLLERAHMWKKQKSDE